MSTSRSRRELQASRLRYAEQERQPLPAPGPHRVSSPEILEKMRRLGHPAELIPPEELPELLEKLRDPEDDQSLR